MSSEGFVMIDRQQAIEAMAFYIAESLMRCPQAVSMNPRQLQIGIVDAIQVRNMSMCAHVCFLLSPPDRRACHVHARVLY